MLAPLKKVSFACSRLLNLKEQATAAFLARASVNKQTVTQSYFMTIFYAILHKLDL